MKFPIEQIWIDEDAQDEALTRQIVRKLPGAGVLVGERFAAERQALLLSPNPIARGKKILRLMRHKGAFVKPCPGTREYVCCGLQILHIGQGCPMDCRYCALQVYFNRPTLELFVNIEDLIGDLTRHLAQDSQRFHRICTGEFTDSLALEPLTGLASRLLGVFSAASNTSLEFKTKTDWIEPLLSVQPFGRIVVSFSVNAGEIVQSEERFAAPLHRRLEAARKAERQGYRIGFHFDPIIPFPGWKEAYAATVQEIFRSVDPAALAWISLGVLRFVPDLKEVARARFGPIRYFHDGFRRGLDGKDRLHADRRIGIYRFLADRIRKHAPEARVYLCMESPHVWKQSLGIAMNSDPDLASYLDAAVR